jgi:adenylate kinase
VEEADEETEAAKLTLQDIKEYMKNNEGRYPLEQVARFVRDKIRTMPCRNQGYVLDGYPPNLALMQQIFSGMTVGCQ